MPRGNYKLEVASPARRDLRRLPGKIASAIIEFITGPLPANPQRLSRPLRHALQGYRSARRGEYRVLFRIDDATHTVVVVAINHRAHAYRPR
ncbi:type II toxin-antitoxin system RelE/ParE family toxin [Mycobacterium sp. E740]|uniref:type II toxin-antitoxin system RelE family toxin n=1 Tax=Mycobacterium sp. E740 TaxID=1834149 RepID=UPI001E474598